MLNPEISEDDKTNPESSAKREQILAVSEEKMINPVIPPPYNTPPFLAHSQTPACMPSKFIRVFSLPISIFRISTPPLLPCPSLYGVGLPGFLDQLSVLSCIIQHYRLLGIRTNR